MSDSSSLSSAQSDIEEPPVFVAHPVQKTLKLKGGKLTFSSTDASSPKGVKNVARAPSSSPEPTPPPREPSPQRDRVLADSPAIAFIVMFRNRFAEAFPKSSQSLGPQDVERGVVDATPSEAIDSLLCALLGLVLNRQKPVERGHYGRALEDAISSNRQQWPKSWCGENLLPGKTTFAELNPEQKIDLLHTLCHWALNSSEVVRGIIAVAYKQARKDDDLNQALSVQPWGLDGRKRRYWLIEGQNDTSFRVYRQSPSRLMTEAWWNVAGSLEELSGLAQKLRTDDGSQAARRLADRMDQAVPRLEATDEKRKRKEYRQNRKALFTRPEPGFSLYEGRTRGKRMKYTFSDDDDTSDGGGGRRSSRRSGGSTPGEMNGPTVTASGRQVRSQFGRSYGDPIRPLDGTSRQTRGQVDSARRSSLNVVSADGREDDDGNEDAPSEEDWKEDEGHEDHDDDESEGEMADGESDDELFPRRSSHIITLKYRRATSNGSNDYRSAVQNGPSNTNSTPARSLTNGFGNHNAIFDVPPSTAEMQQPTDTADAISAPSEQLLTGPDPPPVMAHDSSSSAVDASSRTSNISSGSQSTLDSSIALLHTQQQPTRSPYGPLNSSPIQHKMPASSASTTTNGVPTEHVDIKHHIDAKHYEYRPEPHHAIPAVTPFSHIAGSAYDG